MLPYPLEITILPMFQKAFLLSLSSMQSTSDLEYDAGNCRQCECNLFLPLCACGLSEERDV